MKYEASRTNSKKKSPHDATDFTVFEASVGLFSRTYFHMDCQSVLEGSNFHSESFNEKPFKRLLKVV